MTHWVLRFDLRSPAFGTAHEKLYREALEMATFADAAGWDEIMLSEHHGQPDGYLPAPLVFAAALATRTERIRIRISALVLPFYEPLRVAEDAAVLDLISRGRSELVLAAGFVPSEFALFDRSPAERPERLENGIALLRRAWAGEPFDANGHSIEITPRPFTPGGPRLLLGGSSEHAARRAARLGLDFVPALPGLYPLYERACRERNIEPMPDRILGPPFLHVSRDPEKAWAKIAPHALHETNTYARWYAEGGATGPYTPIEDADELRSAGTYRVLTPEQCVELIDSLGSEAWIFAHPLLAGMNPELGWESLHLLRDEVIPKLRSGQDEPDSN